MTRVCVCRGAEGEVQWPGLRGDPEASHLGAAPSADVPNPAPTPLSGGHRTEAEGRRGETAGMSPASPASPASHAV